MEAEGTCAKLCIDGRVDAVLSEDTDVMAYGSPFMLHRINMQTETVTLIRLSNVLRSLHLTPCEFMDFCIMCGTDYNSNIFMIGPDKAYRYIGIYKSIENLKACQDNIPVENLNFERVRAIFKNTSNIRYDPHYIPFCGPPVLSEELKTFLTEKNIRIELSAFESSFLRCNIPWETTNDVLLTCILPTTTSLRSKQVLQTISI
jgi:5'-3' exonuclease